LQPITFHTYAFEALEGPREGFRIQRRSKLDSQKWVAFEIDEDFGFMIVDDPDVPINVGQDENFETLQPGESWITSRHLQGARWTSLPDDVAVGDVFRYMFKGTTVEWWDWGNREKHMNTVVQLPCWIAGLVTHPTNNEGRPKLVVPASDFVEFTVVE